MAWLDEIPLSLDCDLHAPRRRDHAQATRLTHSLTAVLHILSVNAFQKMAIVELLIETDTGELNLNAPNHLRMNGL
jgi:hypothetical protein